MRARNAGLVEIRYEIVGAAVWPAIVPEEKWNAVCAILDNPDRRVSPGPQAKHLGTNIYACGVCLNEDDAEVFMVGQKLIYHCKRKPHFNRKKAQIDSLIVSEITWKLAKHESVKLLRKPKRGNTDNARASVDSANIRRQLRELEESPRATGLISGCLSGYRLT